jgi:GNAT superfamily N-acetyltransferase
VCHIATTPRLELGAMRAARLVVLPEWQGIGLGTRFLTEVCRLSMTTENTFGARLWRGVYFNTSHPGLIASLRKAPGWRQVSASLYGNNKARCAARINAARQPGDKIHGACYGGPTIIGPGYGGHFRGTVGFLYFLTPE